LWYIFSFRRKPSPTFGSLSSSGRFQRGMTIDDDDDVDDDDDDDDDDA